MYIPRLTLILGAMYFLTACSGGGSSSIANTVVSSGSSTLSDVVMAPAGQVTHYGAVTISDDVGMAYDLVGGFFRLSSGVSEEFLQTMLSGDSPWCTVQDDGSIDFEEISVGYIPTVPGIIKTPVSAGNSILLSSPAGTYATLQEQPGAGFIFYDLPSMDMLEQGSIPEGLLVDIPGSVEIPQFVGIPVPLVTPLVSATNSSGDQISSGTTFSWTPSGNPDALVRIYSSTAGGFFLENGVTVTCVVPDTGTFNYPPTIQALLGPNFLGEAPLMSRLVANTAQVDTTILYVIRESFSAE